MERLLLVTDGSIFSEGATREAIESVTEKVIGLAGCAVLVVTAP